jgi:hypothetical protein
MSLLLIALVALLASGLTLFSGFGLGTLLMPAFALVFPVPVAVAATAVVHLANNLFKLGLLARLAHWPTVARFGLPAAGAAIAGALTLGWFASLPPWFEYQWGGATRVVTPVKAVIGMLILIFALVELSPLTRTLRIPARGLPVGGLLSGFFGGLSGNQGALRAAFLIRAGLDKEGFVATAAVCSVIVDAVRLSVYGAAVVPAVIAHGEALALPVAVACLCAFSGALIGKRLLRKVTLRAVELTVAVAMFVIGAGLIAGIV